MSIEAQWKNKYRQLREYTAANPEIYISTSEVSIPGHLRDGFYEQFDSIRSALVEDRFAALPVDMDALKASYTRSEKEAKDRLGLDSIYIPVDLSSFLHDPKTGLTRAIYNRLFELVQGKMNEEEFEHLASADIDVTAANFFRLGYEPWAALSLILLLEPDRIYGVEFDEEHEPVVSELKELAFGRQFYHPAKRIPECILHSKKLDRHIAIKMPLAREVHSYYIPFEPPVKPKKRTGDTSFVLDSRVMFLSSVPDLKKIPVFADIHARTIQSPDLMVEFLTRWGATDPDTMKDVQTRTEIMKPKSGTCVVLIDPDNDEPVENFPDTIELVAAGFDDSKLQTVIDRLT